MRSATINAAKFKEIKTALKTSGKAQTTANRQGVSLETLRKVKNSKTFVEYQEANKASHRKTSWQSTVTENPAPQDKRGFWARLFNI